MRKKLLIIIAYAAVLATGAGLPVDLPEMARARMLGRPEVQPLQELEAPARGAIPKLEQTTGGQIRRAAGREKQSQMLPEAKGTHRMPGMRIQQMGLRRTVTAGAQRTLPELRKIRNRQGIMTRPVRSREQ